MFIISSLIFLLYLLIIGIFFVRCRTVYGALPIIFVLFWFAVKMPFYIFYSASQSPLFSDLDITIENFLYLLAIKSVFIFICSIAFFVFTKNQRFGSYKDFIVKEWFVWLTLLIGVFFLAIYLHNIGGFSYIWNHMSMRAVFTHGNTFLLIFSWMFFCLSVVISIRSWPLIGQGCLVLFCGVAIYLAYGSRSLGFSVFLVWIVAYYYLNSVAPFKFYKIRYLFIYVIALVIFVATPLFRDSGAFQRYLNDQRTLVEDVSGNYSEIFHRFSVPYIELLVLKHFDHRNYWAGTSFLDARYFFCPVSVCKAKPPLDDGVYLYNISLGENVILGTPVSELKATSYPFETWTIMYANFGVAGVAIGGLLQGILLALFYNLCFSGKIANQFVGASSMGLVATGFFHLTNNYIGHFFFPIFFQWVVLSSVGPLVFRKCLNNNGLLPAANDNTGRA